MSHVAYLRVRFIVLFSFFIHSSAGSELVLLFVFVLLLRDDGRGNPVDSWNQKGK